MLHLFELPSETEQINSNFHFAQIQIDSNFISKLFNTKSSLKYKILVLSGPSGAGKSYIIQKCLQDVEGRFSLIPRVTTRLRRKFENPQELEFVSTEHFEGLVINNQLLYAENNSGNRYGVRVEDILDKLHESLPGTVMLLIGTISLAQLFPKTGYVYFWPPKRSVLIDRLRKTNRYTPEKVEESIAEAKYIWSKRAVLPILQSASFLNNADHDEIATVNKLYRYASSGTPTVEDIIV